MKRIAEMQLRRILSFFLVLSMCVGQGYAAEATAATVQLMKTEGTAGVTNSGGRALTVRENMRLYSGYHVNTEAKSYAWVNLDDTKLNKLDESSEIELRKENRKLEVLLNEGNLYFNVEKPLEESESMNIRTSTMVVGIRGTCGWVRVVDRWTTEVNVLEGTVQCTVTDPVSGQSKTTTIKGGEQAVFAVYDPTRAGDKCDILRDNFTEEDVPGFVLVELVRDTPLCEKIYADSGIDLLPITREEAEDRLKSDQEEHEEELEEREQLVSEQERHVSVDPVWKGDTPSSSGTSSGGGGGTSSGPSGVIRLTMPVTAREVQNYLDIPAVTGVVLLPGSGNNTFSVDIAMTVPGGKSLTLNTGVPARVEAGNSMTVNGTAGLNDALTNLGTVTVNSANTLRVVGNLTNNSTMIVPSTGRSITEGTFTNNRTLTPAAGAQVLARTFDLAAPVTGWTVTGPQSDGYYRLVQTQPAHTVTFDANGGSVTPASAETGTDGKLASLPTPTRTDYVFGGWFTAQTGGNEVTTSTVFTQDTTVYARWGGTPAPTTYHISLNYNYEGGNGPAVSTRADGTLSVANLAAPTRTGYTFDGWFTAASGGTQVTTSTVFSADTTIYAHWTQNVTATISGTVNMPAETEGGAATPVSGATVQLFQDGSATARAARAANRTVVAATTTDSSGTYSLPISVAPGEYTLAADSPGYTAEQTITIAENTTAYDNMNFELSDAWDYDDTTKTLTIKGNGPMADYDYSVGAPWSANQSDITTVEISDSVTSIGDSAFYGYTTLTSVVIPGCVTDINAGAFYECTSLSSVTFSEGTETLRIRINAFYGCTGLSEITIPDRVIVIEPAAFRACTNLTSITIPDSVTNVMNSAFRGCENLKSAVIGNGVTSIEAEVFEECVRLTSVTIPDSVTSIKNFAFNSCTSLTDVYYAGTVEQWNAITIGSNNNALTNATRHYSGTTEGEETP